MDNNYFDENLQSNGVKHSNKNSVSISTLIISLITTIVLVVIVVNNLDNIKEIFGMKSDISEISQFEQLVVGDEVKLSGYISDDGDLINYTHVFSSKEYGNLGLKSQNINLNNYNGNIYFEGIVEKIYQGMPIIEVDTIYSLDINKYSGGVVEVGSTGNTIKTKYLPNVGLYLNGDFFEKYSLVNEGNDGVLKIKNINTNQIVFIDYFKCNTAVDEQNCDRFNKMFATSSVEKFVQSDGTVYYKQSEIESWFFSNGSLLGYFINDTKDVIVKNLVKYITIVNEDFVEKNVLENVDTLCRKPGLALKNIKNHTLFMKNNELYLDVEGDDGLESKLSCELKVDVTAKNMSKLIKLDVLEKLDKDEANNDSGQSEDTDNSVNEEDVENSNRKVAEKSDWNSDVEQFLINLEKSLEFTSRRGHTIVFPSSNIAYAGKSIQEDFGQTGVNCFSVMNVVKYDEKEYVNQKGSVKIYECSVKNGFDDVSEQLIYKEVGDKHFVIEIVDPSWVNFANNIKILIK